MTSWGASRGEMDPSTRGHHTCALGRFDAGGVEESVGVVASGKC